MRPATSEASNAECIAFVNDSQTHDVASSVLAEHFTSPSIMEGSTNEVIQYLSEAPPPHVLLVDLADAGSPLDRHHVLDGGPAGGDPHHRHRRCQRRRPLPRDHRCRRRRLCGKAGHGKGAEHGAAKDQGAANTPGSNRGRGQTDADRRNRIARRGAGVSTVATNLAWVISDELKRRTVLVDLDLEFGTIALSLDLEPTRGLREALENPSRIDSLFISSATAKLTDTLSVMATEETLADDIHFNPNAVDVLFDTLGRNCDTIVVDVPRPNFTVRQKVLEAATQIVLVTETNLAGLRDSIRILASIEEVAPETPVTIIANRAGGPAQAMPIAEFQKALGRKIDHQIPDESKLLNKAANNGKPLAQQDKRGKTAKEIQKLAKAVGGDPAEVDKKKTKGGLARLFKGK